jgi:peptidoglycan/xylan/chitin deacetylase (PgdA/CDA1 family)
MDIIYPKRLWHIPHAEKKVFLTFDDGPTSELTDWILDTLNEFHARATFFCVGENVQRHAGKFERILDNGHTVGNHTHRHLNGWESPNGNYIEDIAACANVLSSKLFRPPYGRITSQQVEALLLQGYRIVMWSVLTHDFDPSLDPEKCWNYLKKSIKPGDIVVFHDSEKARENLRYLLPRTLEHFSAQGYVFDVI